MRNDKMASIWKIYLHILNMRGKWEKVTPLNFSENSTVSKIIILPFLELNTMHIHTLTYSSAQEYLYQYKSYVRVIISVYKVYISYTINLAFLQNSRLVWIGVCNLLPVHQILVFASVNRTGSCPLHKVMRYEPNVGSFK